MMKNRRGSSLYVLLTLVLVFIFGQDAFGQNISGSKRPSIGLAMEFNDHAACAYIARDKGWFTAEGINISAYKSYATGMALSAALARGDIQVAYMCLIPAINAYANARVPIRIVAGTHKYGYGVVVNKDKVKDIKDLENPAIRIGCVRQGGTVDVIMHKVIDRYHLDETKILRNIRRMNPARQVMAIKMGQLDAAFMPEHWLAMAENLGFTILITTQDVWPDMQGSVLVVKEELIKTSPDVVEKLVKVTRKGTMWLNQDGRDASTILARQFSIEKKNYLPSKVDAESNNLEITPEVIDRSMKRILFTTNIDPNMVQEMIDYVASLGYIKQGIKADAVLDLRFLKDE